MQNAVTVEMNVKYHSNQKKTDLFIAEIVSQNIDHNATIQDLVEVQDKFYLTSSNLLWNIEFYKNIWPKHLSQQIINSIQWDYERVLVDSV